MVSKSYYFTECDIKLNPGKNIACTFGVGIAHQLEMCNFSLNSYSCQPKLNNYLGCQFKCYMCEIDTQSFICNFYGAFNNILRVIASKTNEMVAVCSEFKN